MRCIPTLILINNFVNSLVELFLQILKEDGTPYGAPPSFNYSQITNY